MTGRTGARTRRRTAALLAGGVLLALLLAGCGVRPSGVVVGGPAPVGPVGSFGVSLYFVWHGELAPVVRPTAQRLSPVQALSLLAGGPDGNERDQGLTSEVPQDLVPTAPPELEADQIGLMVTMSGAVTTLSATAADQIVCTATSAAVPAAPGGQPTPIIISGPDGSRPPQLCPY